MFWGENVLCAQIELEKPACLKVRKFWSISQDFSEPFISSMSHEALKRKYSMLCFPQNTMANLPEIPYVMLRDSLRRI